MINPIHPNCLQQCDRPSKKNGKTAAGTQRYRCPCCGKTWTLKPQSAGPKLKGKRKLTNAERQQRWRQRNQSRGSSS